MLAETAHLCGDLGIIHVLNGLLLKPNHHSMIAVSANTKKAKQQTNKQFRPNEQFRPESKKQYIHILSKCWPKLLICLVIWILFMY